MTDFRIWYTLSNKYCVLYTAQLLAFEITSRQLLGIWHAWQQSTASLWYIIPQSFGWWLEHLGQGYEGQLLVEFLALEVWGHDNCIWVLTERRSLTVWNSQPNTPSPPLDNIRVMVIVWRLRRNIIRTAPCWVVWHNVHSQQYTHVSSSYRSSRLGLSHWDPYTMHRGGCLELYYFSMVKWCWWDTSLICKTN